MKTIYNTKVLFSAFLGLLILFGSCTSTTLITTDPPQADVYINGEYVGKSPVPYEDEKIIFSDNTVRITKEGYQEYYDFFSKNEEPNVGAIIGGFFIWPVWLWAFEYKPEHHYKLQPVE